jgi:hypothetical protein
MGKLIHFSYFLFSFGAGMPEGKVEARQKDREKIQELEQTLFELRGEIGAGRHVHYHKIVLTTAGYRESGSNEGRQCALHGRLVWYFGMVSYDFRHFIPFRVHHGHLHLTVLILRPYCTAIADIHDRLLTVNWTVRSTSLTTDPTYESFVLIHRGVPLGSIE